MKKGLSRLRYRIVQRLLEDHSPQNPYRRGVYVSVTGGGTSNTPLFFATNPQENRRQRAEFGRLLSATGVASSMDCVVTVHTSGGLYRYGVLQNLYIERALG
jgi:hypothetical protein